MTNMTQLGSGLSPETIVLMITASIGYALYISGEQLERRALKKGSSSPSAPLFKKIGSPLMIISIGIFLFGWLVSKL
ncbi:MAG: hypothetical protein VW472_05560 [Candidatus Puniceispirillum sp.]